MKRISILLALALSLSLLSACGSNEPAANTENPSTDPSANTQQVPDESAEQTAGSGANFLSPEYDYTTNLLGLHFSQLCPLPPGGRKFHQVGHTLWKGPGGVPHPLSGGSGEIPGSPGCRRGPASQPL